MELFKISRMFYKYDAPLEPTKRIKKIALYNKSDNQPKNKNPDVDLGFSMIVVGLQPIRKVLPMDLELIVISLEKLSLSFFFLLFRK